MKISEIKTDGTVYWYETAQNWGTYIRADYQRGPVRRADDQRYSPGWPRHTYRPDPNGKYIRVTRTPMHDGDGRYGTQELYVQPSTIRDTYDAVKARCDAAEVASRTEAERKNAANAEMRQQVADLAARAERTGLQVNVTGQPADYRHHQPTIRVTMSPEALDALLGRLES